MANTHEQLTNRKLYSLVEGLINTKIGEVFEAIGALATHMDNRFNEVDARFEGVDKRFQGIDERLDMLESGQQGIRFEIHQMNERIHTLETRVEANSEDIMMALSIMVTKDDLKRCQTAHA